VAELGRRIDELERDLLEGRSRRLWDQRLSERDHSLLGSDDTTFDHKEVFIDDTIVREATEGSDLLLSEISSSGRRVGSGAPESIDLLVDLRSMVVTILTSARHRPLNSRRMPRSDTRDLSEALVSFAGQFGGAPTSGDTLETVSLRDSDRVDLLVLFEHCVHRDLLLEQAQREVHLLRRRSSIDLDFQNVGLLLSEVELSDLGVGNDSDGGAKLFDPLDVKIDRSLLLGGLVFQSVLGESLLL